MCNESTQYPRQRFPRSYISTLFSNRELERAGFDFVREAEQNIYYEGINVGTRRADFVVENKVIVELKALTNLEDVHLAQAKNYVVAYKFEKGLLINFGATSLQYKLIFNSNQNSVNPRIL